MGKKKDLSHHQIARLRQRAWAYEQMGFGPAQIAKTMGRDRSTIWRWLKEFRAIDDKALLDKTRETLEAYRILCWTWTTKADELLEQLEENPNDLLLRQRFELAQSHATRWQQKWDSAVLIAWRALAQAAAQRTSGGQVAQFYYDSEEFYREIREARRRVPLLAGQQPETAEEKQKRLDEFMRTHGTEKLPTETI